MVLPCCAHQQEAMTTLYDEDFTLYSKLDKLVGCPLNSQRDIEGWIRSMKSKLGNSRSFECEGASTEYLIVDSIVNQINVNDLRKQVDWMLAYHGYTLQTVFGYLELVATYNGLVQ